MGSMKDLLGDTLFDERTAAVAVKRRDKALDRVKKNSGPWFQDAMAVIEHLPSEWRGIGEDLRPLIVKQAGPPHHHNAWGSLVGHAVRRNLLILTGERRQMRSGTSKARKSDVYRPRPRD